MNALKDECVTTHPTDYLIRMSSDQPAILWEQAMGRKAARVELTRERLTPPTGFEARPHHRMRLPSKKLYAADGYYLPVTLFPYCLICFTYYTLLFKYYSKILSEEDNKPLQHKVVSPQGVWPQDVCVFQATSIADPIKKFQ